jgi:type II secretory pathway component PulM
MKMVREAVEKTLKLWERLSRREQMLAAATGAIVVLVLVYAGFISSQNRLRQLDDDIDRLEEDLVHNTGLLQRREAIEFEYSAIAAQHSSEWTEAEIHDRLRQEIYRLAQTTPAPLDQNGIPLSNPGNIGNLVDIPSLGKGQMAEGGKGYREYRINMRIPPSPLRNIIQFLERLHNSPQSLRIDALDLNRSPEQELVAASIDISRIVADGATLIAPATVQESSPGGLGRINLNAEAWKASNASVQNAPSQSIHGAVTIQMMAAGAEVYMNRSLAGGVYEMIANISSNSPDVVVGVGDGATGAPLSPMQPLTGNGEVTRYQVQFSIPDGGAPVTIQCPAIQSASSTGAMIQVTGLLLQEASEVYQ